MKEKPITNKPKYPELFEEIIRNENEIRDVIAAHQTGPIPTRQQWIAFGNKMNELTNRKRELIRAAEEFLKWNKNKGSRT